MAFSSSFRFQVVARVALIGALLFLLVWSLLRTTWDAMPVVAGLLLAVAMLSLVRYVERGTRDLTHLLRAVAGGDFTTALPERSSKPPFSEYARASRILIDAYQRLDLQRAASGHLLQATVEHVGAAVLCFGADGRIAFANSAARDLLGTPGLGTLHQLATVDPLLPGRLLALRDDERAQLPLTLHGQPAQLLLHARRFSLLDEAFTVVACQDIREQLESRDVEAWQALTRVLTHEMMNSLTPIMTLSKLLRETVSPAQAGEDVTESIEVIHERSAGLANFIQAYRQFSNPPQPAPAMIAAATLLERVARLKRPELEQAGIQMDLILDARDLTVHADAHQIEQTLINLIRNAQDVLNATPGARIALHATRDARGRTLVHVTDNGPGIPAELMPRVFVPFFTTRVGGTGVGLSLSRQLIKLNGGTLTVESAPGRCRFTLRLPATAE